MRKPMLTGTAAFMQGYEARDGLGITRTRYHRVAKAPAAGAIHHGNALLRSPIMRPVFLQKLKCFEKNMVSLMLQGDLLDYGPSAANK